jgi:hypothetical protein
VTQSPLSCHRHELTIETWIAVKREEAMLLVLVLVGDRYFDRAVVVISLRKCHLIVPIR